MPVPKWGFTGISQSMAVSDFEETHTHCLPFRLASDCLFALKGGLAAWPGPDTLSYRCSRGAFPTPSLIILGF